MAPLISQLLNLDLQDPLGEERQWNGIDVETSEVQGKKRSRVPSHPQPSTSKPEWESSPKRDSVSKSVPKYPNSRTGSVSSEPKVDQIRSSEVIYYTERLKEHYDRSNDDVTSAISSGQKRKYLDQLKDQLKLGQSEQSKAVVPYDPDPRGIKKNLQPLGKEGLLKLIVTMAKELEESGKSVEIPRLLDAVSGILLQPLLLTLQVYSFQIRGMRVIYMYVVTGYANNAGHILLAATIYLFHCIT